MAGNWGKFNILPNQSKGQRHRIFDFGNLSEKNQFPLSSCYGNYLITIVSGNLQRYFDKL
jgi:hypothetical protein